MCCRLLGPDGLFQVAQTGPTEGSVAGTRGLAMTRNSKPMIWLGSGWWAQRDSNP